MPHLDLRFDEKLVSGELIFGAATELIEIVSKHFDENPDYISVEVLPQTRWSLNRKAVDIELNSSPDPDGLRAKASQLLAKELADCLVAYLARAGINCEVSAWVRIFSTGFYEYRNGQSQ